MEFRATTQEDLDYVRRNPLEDAVKNYPHMQIPDENCITAILGGHIVGVGGVIVLWPGVGELWLMLTVDCKKHGAHGLFAINVIRNKIDEILRMFRRSSRRRRQASSVRSSA